jgi:hypothetical protein
MAECQTVRWLFATTCDKAIRYGAANSRLNGAKSGTTRSQPVCSGRWPRGSPDSPLANSSRG